jgi:hypothetical protein
MAEARSCIWIGRIIRKRRPKPPFLLPRQRKRPKPKASKASAGQDEGGGEAADAIVKVAPSTRTMRMPLRRGSQKKRPSRLKAKSRKRQAPRPVPTSKLAKVRAAEAAVGDAVEGHANGSLALKKVPRPRARCMATRRGSRLSPKRMLARVTLKADSGRTAPSMLCTNTQRTLRHEKLTSGAIASQSASSRR